MGPLAGSAVPKSVVVARARGSDGSKNPQSTGSPLIPSVAWRPALKKVVGPWLCVPALRRVCQFEDKRLCCSFSAAWEQVGFRCCGHPSPCAALTVGHICKRVKSTARTYSPRVSHRLCPAVKIDGNVCSQLDTAAKHMLRFPNGTAWLRTRPIFPPRGATPHLSRYPPADVPSRMASPSPSPCRPAPDWRR
jgi:hypothetical protein